jgi:hypothetical protein
MQVGQQMRVGQAAVMASQASWHRKTMQSALVSGAISLLEFSTLFVLSFCRNHHLLQVNKDQSSIASLTNSWLWMLIFFSFIWILYSAVWSPQWLTVKGQVP